MSDERSFIEQTQSRAKGHFGRELSPAEMATEFAKLGINERVEALDRLDRDNADGEPLSIRAAAKRHSYVSALRGTHEKLRKVDR